MDKAASRLVRSVAYTMAYRSGLLRTAMRVTDWRERLTEQRPFQILVYHRVGVDRDPYVPARHVAGFERQMRFLSRHYRVLSLTALLAAAKRNEIPRRAVAVTFDDGYEDVYTFALPVLQRCRIPAMVYLATGFVQSGDAMWNDRIGAAIRDTRREKLDAVGEGMRDLPLRTEEERRQALAYVLGLLKRRPPDERDELTGAVVRSLGVREERLPRMLSWDQVRHMRDAGIEFGAHTVRHPILSCVPAGEAMGEIVESKRTIEGEVQQPVLHFAYPNGRASDFNAATKRLLVNAGFESAVSTIFGCNTRETDRYALRRGGPSEDATNAFASKLWWYRLSGHRADEPSQQANALGKPLAAVKAARSAHLDEPRT